MHPECVADADAGGEGRQLLTGNVLWITLRLCLWGALPGQLLGGVSRSVGLVLMCGRWGRQLLTGIAVLFHHQPPATARRHTVDTDNLLADVIDETAA